MFLENTKNEQRILTQQDDVSKEMKRLMERIDFDRRKDEKQLAYYREICRQDPCMARLCDEEEQLLGKLTRLNWRYRHE